MRKFTMIILLLMGTLLSAEGFASELGYETSYARALALAKKSGKDVMLVVVTDYCPWCRKMERQTLSNSKIDARVKKNYIPVVIDRNHDKGNYPKIYETPRIPTVFFINADNSSHYWESIGFKSKKEFAQVLEDAPQNRNVLQ